MGGEGGVRVTGAANQSWRKEGAEAKKRGSSRRTGGAGGGGVGGES